MVTKEGIIKQILADFLVHEGYFVQQNISFCPAKIVMNLFQIWIRIVATST